MKSWNLARVRLNLGMLTAGCLIAASLNGWERGVIWLFLAGVSHIASTAAGFYVDAAGADQVEKHSSGAIRSEA